MHKGVVIKSNANQRYATTSITAFLVKELARRHKLPVQEFVVRNDSPCGSTIGPILSAGCGIRTIDVGCPQWSMHSIRETASVDDLGNAISLFVVSLPAVYSSLLYSAPAKRMLYLLGLLQRLYRLGSVLGGRLTLC